MLRHSLIAAAFALATVTFSAVPGSPATANLNGHPYHRTVVHPVYSYEPAPSPYYYAPYYGPRLMLRWCRSLLYPAPQFVLPSL